MNHELLRELEQGAQYIQLIIIIINSKLQTSGSSSKLQHQHQLHRAIARPPL